MLKHCSLYWSRHAVSYPSNAYLQRHGGSDSSHAPSFAALCPASASRRASRSLPRPPCSSHCKQPCRINQRLEPHMTESWGWGGGITKTKIKEHLLAHVCQPSQLKEQEENKAWQEGRQLFFSPWRVFSFPYRACSFPAFRPLHILHPWQVCPNWNTFFTERFRHINISITDMA